MSVLSYVAAVGLSRSTLHPLAGMDRLTRRQTLLSLSLLAAIGLCGRLGYEYWTVGRFLQSTDNAYIHVDYTTIAPRISGYVADVFVRDNEVVEAGQVLARIDDRDLNVALDAASADVAEAEAALRHLDARIAQQRLAIDGEKADIAASKATRDLAQAENVRYEDLRRSGYGSVQRAQQAETALRERIALLRKSRSALVAAQRQVDVLLSQRARAEAQRERALAARRQAELHLSYVSITAPLAGTIGARSLRVGQYVQAGTPLMAVVPLTAAYVVANYKETQLSGVAPGQSVEITVDSFPGVPLRGRVDSLAPASGQQFALLPAQNATGNFTKIVQRVPVRIAIDDDALAGRLRAGMSVRSTIDTRN